MFGSCGGSFLLRIRELAGVASVAFVAMAVAMAIQSAHISFAMLGRPTPEPVRLASNDPAALPVKDVQSERPAATKVQPPPRPEASPPFQASPDEVALRVRESVPAQLYPYFDVFLYVSKAVAGPWAQHMFIFHKGNDGGLVFEKAIPVSTGRERREKYFTDTPEGLFELDPNRFDRVHFSHVWDGAAMPWAMFLNYTVHGHAAGIALHAWAGHEVPLGQRASGGCVRLPPDQAEYLFKRFQAEEGGMVPVFAVDPAGPTTRKDGAILTDGTGQPELYWGYRVLVIIQDYPGAPALVAELDPAAAGSVAK